LLILPYPPYDRFHVQQQQTHLSISLKHSEIMMTLDFTEAFSKFISVASVSDASFALAKISTTIPISSSQI
jgi:hypothetical protein